MYVVPSLVFQLLSVKDSLHEVRHPSNLGIRSIGNAAKDIMDGEDEFPCATEGEFSGGNLYSYLQQSDRFIGDAFPAEVW